MQTLETCMEGLVALSNGTRCDVKRGVLPSAHERVAHSSSIGKSSEGRRPREPWTAEPWRPAAPGAPQCGPGGRRRRHRSRPGAPQREPPRATSSEQVKHVTRPGGRTHSGSDLSLPKKKHPKKIPEGLAIKCQGSRRRALTAAAAAGSGAAGASFGLS